MCRCEFERDAAACLSRRMTPTPEEARGAYLASRHPCDSCVIGTRRAREDAERRAVERMRALGFPPIHPLDARVSPGTCFSDSDGRRQTETRSRSSARRISPA